MFSWILWKIVSDSLSMQRLGMPHCNWLHPDKLYMFVIFIQYYFLSYHFCNMKCINYKILNKINCKFKIYISYMFFFTTAMILLLILIMNVVFDITIRQIYQYCLPVSNKILRSSFQVNKFKYQIKIFFEKNACFISYYLNLVCT